MALALDAGVKQLVLFHHDPDRDDAAVETLERMGQALAGERLVVRAAREGDQYRLGAG